MKRLSFALLAAVALMGQSAPTGSLIPEATGPMLIVYPFTVSSTIEPSAGGKLALLIAARLAQNTDVRIKDPASGLDRTQFLESARASGADYYVTGYVTPLGNDVTLVVQLVSTSSGILVWSDTAEVRTYGEAGAQADLIRQVILAREGHGLPSIPHGSQSPSPAPSASPKK